MSISCGPEQVLGQLLSPQVKKARERENSRWLESHWKDDIISIDAAEEAGAHCSLQKNYAACRKGLQEWLLRQLTQKPTSPEGTQAWAREVLDALPADVAVSANIETYTVPPTDKRAGLHGELGCRAAVPTAGTAGKVLLPHGSVIGVYRGQQLFSSEYSKFKHTPGLGFGGNMFSWRMKCDSYGVDIKFRSSTNMPQSESAAPSPLKPQLKAKGSIRPVGPVATGLKSNKQPAKGSRKKTFPVDTPREEIQQYELVTSAFLVGNETRLVNDPTVNPMGDGLSETVRPENVTVLSVRIGGWVYPIMVATADIREGEELAYSYGQGYWDMFSDHLKELEEAEAIARPLKLLELAMDVLKRKLTRCYKLHPETEEIVEYQEAAMEAARQLAVTADQPEGDGQTGDKATPSSMGRENTVETESVQDERSRVPETAGASVGHRRKVKVARKVGGPLLMAQRALRARPSEYKQVQSSGNGWIASIGARDQITQLPDLYETAEDAARARDAAIVTLRLDPKELALRNENKVYAEWYKGYKQTYKECPAPSGRSWWIERGGKHFRGVIPSPEEGYWDVMARQKDREELLHLGRFKNQIQAAIVWELHACKQGLTERNFPGARQEDLRTGLAALRRKNAPAQPVPIARAGPGSVGGGNRPSNLSEAGVRQRQQDSAAVAGSEAVRGSPAPIEPQTALPEAGLTESQQPSQSRSQLRPRSPTASGSKAPEQTAQPEPVAPSTLPAPPPSLTAKGSSTLPDSTKKGSPTASGSKAPDPTPQPQPVAPAPVSSVPAPATLLTAKGSSTLPDSTRKGSPTASGSKKPDQAPQPQPVAPAPVISLPPPTAFLPAEGSSTLPDPLKKGSQPHAAPKSSLGAQAPEAEAPKSAHLDAPSRLGSSSQGPQGSEDARRAIRNERSIHSPSRSPPGQRRQQTKGKQHPAAAEAYPVGRHGHLRERMDRLGSKEGASHASRSPRNDSAAGPRDISTKTQPKVSSLPPLNSRTSLEKASSSQPELLTKSSRNHSVASGASPSMFLSTSLPDTRQASQRHGSNSMRGVRDQLRPADVKPKAAPLDPIKSASLLEPPQDKAVHEAKRGTTHQSPSVDQRQPTSSLPAAATKAVSEPRMNQQVAYTRPITPPMTGMEESHAGGAGAPPPATAVGDVDGLELGADYIPLQDLPSISASELLGMGLGYADAEIVRALNFLPEQK